MVMDLADKGVPVKIVGLGHRSGAVIMVKTDSPYKTFADLRGKRVAIPSRFAVDHIFVRKIMKQHGMTTRDLELIEMPPPDMPAALYAGAVAGVCYGRALWGGGAEGRLWATTVHDTRLLAELSLLLCV